MFRFKAGIAIGFGLGWLVASGKGAELLARFRQRRRSGATDTAETSGGVYDFAVRAAQ